MRRLRTRDHDVTWRLSASSSREDHWLTAGLSDTCVQLVLMRVNSPQPVLETHKLLGHKSTLMPSRVSLYYL